MGTTLSSWTSSKKNGARQIDVLPKTKMSVLALLQISDESYGVKAFCNSGAQQVARTHDPEF